MSPERSRQSTERQDWTGLEFVSPTVLHMATEEALRTGVQTKDVLREWLDRVVENIQADHQQDTQDGIPSSGFPAE